jgi:hypothetical protein
MKYFRTVRYRRSLCPESAHSTTQQTATHTTVKTLRGKHHVYLAHAVLGQLPAQAVRRLVALHNVGDASIAKLLTRGR